MFAQRSDAALDLSAIRSQAVRFFDAKIGFTADKVFSSNVPLTDNVEIMVARDSLRGTRPCFGRPADPGDYAAAEAAERAQNTYGMSLLAARCRMVWLVPREGDGEDPVGLLIAAILASTLLGPILAPSGTELFGVRTARIKLGL